MHDYRVRVWTYHRSDASVTEETVTVRAWDSDEAASKALKTQFDVQQSMITSLRRART